MKPVMLLIPGMLNDAGVWAHVTPRLGDLALVRIAEVGRQETIDAMARDAWTQLADLPPQQPLVLAGFSMGGYVLLQMLATAPRPVTAIALLDSSARVETPETLVMREKIMAAMQRDFARTTQNFLAFNTHPANQGNAALMAEALDGMRRAGAQVGVRQNRAIANRADHRALLAGLSLPALVLCGRADQVTPPECAQELADLIPGARLVWIENAGHMTLLEQPEAVAQALRELLTCLPAQNAAA